MMNVLEKILEEIRDNAKLGNMHWEAIRIEKVEDIIRSHMDDVPDNNAGWIPVSEKLPEESDYYMACICNDEVCDYDFRKTWFAHADDYDMDKSEWRELYDFERVIAWQPLPEPYKEK
ncbi:DUF551 domain-containing protein [Mediterraneibacter gnavus]|uniref:DUF551 domain-containing protein n=2 Tax=Mediterraneibacter gnavus TaxID=33038 RepID=UPI00232C1A76|nr:DUF551 domain-containing protein [Mediterraneibacter gnavus]MDB8715143.1 DUF551 domain-containing protein [Mediterraneibacter gnavus]